MLTLPASEILFFLWYDQQVIFDLPGGIVGADPVTYTIEWLGEDDFAHSWSVSSAANHCLGVLYVQMTMRFIHRNAKYFREPLLETSTPRFRGDQIK